MTVIFEEPVAYSQRNETPEDVKALLTSNFKDAQTCFPGEVPDFIYYIEYWKQNSTS